MEELVDVLVPLGAFALVVLSVYFVSKYSYRTQKAILEHGGTIEQTQSKKRFRYLEFALAAIGCGLGLVFSALLKLTNLPEDAIDILTGGFIFVFIGIGLVSAIAIRQKIEKSDK